jgi:hypothetical protein
MIKETNRKKKKKEQEEAVEVAAAHPKCRKLWNSNSYQRQRQVQLEKVMMYILHSISILKIQR